MSWMDALVEPMGPRSTKARCDNCGAPEDPAKDRCRYCDVAYAKATVHVGLRLAAASSYAETWAPTPVTEAVAWSRGRAPPPIVAPPPQRFRE